MDHTHLAGDECATNTTPAMGIYINEVLTFVIFPSSQNLHLLLIKAVP
jgi:hypothetical protein